MKILFALVLLTAPAWGQFTNAHSIWGRPVSSAAPTDGYAITWSASQSKFIFAAGGGGASVCDISTGGSIGATATFNAASCNAVSGTYATFNNLTTPLLANVTAVTFSNLVAGTQYSFRMYQGTVTGPYTVQWPASVKGGCTIDPTLGTYTTMTGYWDGTSLFVNGNCTTSDTPYILRGPTRGAPLAPTAGLACWLDNITLTEQCMDPNAQQYGMPMMTTYPSTGPAVLSPMLNALAIPILNDVSTGTTLNTLTKVSSAAKAIKAAVTDTFGIVGITAGGAGIAGTASVVTHGIARCLFDAVTVVTGHWVQISSTVAGSCVDAGATMPVTGQVIGVALEGGTGPNAYKVLVNLGTGPAYVQSTTTPSVNATSCTGATIGANSTNAAGTITGLPASACTVVLTFASATAAHGWSCAVSDQTIANTFRQSASSTTTVTFIGTSSAADVLAYGPCAAY